MAKKPVNPFSALKALRTNQALAKRAAELLKRLNKAPSKTIESGRVGVSQSALEARLPQIVTARKMADRLQGQAKEKMLARVAALEKQAANSLRAEAPPTGPGRPAVARPGVRTPIQPSGNVAVPTMPLERRGVPNPQAERRDTYQDLYGTDRDVSPPMEAPADFQELIIEGPRALNHEARLRKTGRVCGHWAMYSYLLNVDGTPTLGVQFVNGFRAAYPGTTEVDFRAINNAESGSYYAWDYLRRRPYFGF